MEDKKKCQDLEEDEELSNLRLAALATLHREKKSKPDTVDTVSHILPISSIARVSDFSSDPGSHKNKNSWRNNTQSSKRKGKNFPKSSQRSNLIVITPVNADNRKAFPEQQAAPKLLLPQYKWLQSNNEDSSSPKTDRRTGPSRFNRHGSESESSDSDYDNSDDSYSNDTVLLDERSRMSVSESNEETSELKNDVSSDQRISFQNFDSKLDNNNKNDNSDVYNSIKTSQLPDKDLSNVTDQDNSELSRAQSKTSNYNVCNGEVDEVKHNASKTDPSSILDNRIIDSPADSPSEARQKRKHTPIKFDLRNDSDQPKTKRLASTDLKDWSINPLHKHKEEKNHSDVECRSSDSTEHKISSLSKNDLRFELKRKKANVEKDDLPKKQNKSDKIERPPSKDRFIHRFRSRSRSPVNRHNKHSHNRHRSRSTDRKRSRYEKNHSSSSSQSSRSSSSSSYSSSASSSGSERRKNCVSSVIKPVQSKIVLSDSQNNVLKSSVNRKTYLSSSEIDSSIVKKAKGIEIKLKCMSNIKISVPANDPKINVPDGKKRGPVHMRLGTLPRKRIIQMPKDVEAAFVTTSSDDDNDVNSKCKKSNIVVVTELYDKKVDGMLKHPEKNVLPKSEVTSSGRGRVFR